MRVAAARRGAVPAARARRRFLATESFFERQQQTDFAAENWGRGASEYGRAFGEKFESYAAAALDQVAERLGDNGGRPLRLLDVGCGAGAVASALAAHPLAQPPRPPPQVLCTDFSEAMVVSCTAALQDLGRRVPVAAQWRCEQQDGMALREQSGHYDACVAMFSVMFFPDRAAGLRELRRVLRPGGCAVVGGWASMKQLEWVYLGNKALKKALGDKVDSLGMPPKSAVPNFLAFSDPEGFAGMLTDAGLVDAAVVPVRRRFLLRDAAAAVQMWRDMATAFPTLAYTIDELAGGDPQAAAEAADAVAQEFAAIVLARGGGDSDAAGYLDGTALLGVASSP